LNRPKEKWGGNEKGATMAKKKRDKVKQFVGELIKNELEAQLAKMVRKARKKASKEAGKLNNMLRLEYRKDEGFVDAEVIEGFAEEEGKKDEAHGEKRGVLILAKHARRTPKHGDLRWD